MKNKKEEIRVVGRCGYCEQLVYSNQKYEELQFARPLPWKDGYMTGPIHKQCRVPALKRFNKDLMKDVETLNWMLEGVLKTKEVQK